MEPRSPDQDSKRHRGIKAEKAVFQVERVAMSRQDSKRHHDIKHEIQHRSPFKPF